MLSVLISISSLGGFCSIIFILWSNEAEAKAFLFLWIRQPKEACPEKLKTASGPGAYTSPNFTLWQHCFLLCIRESKAFGVSSLVLPFLLLLLSVWFLLVQHRKKAGFKYSWSPSTLYARIRTFKPIALGTREDLGRDRNRDCIFSKG